MRVGGQQATDPTIAEDMKNFSAQEAQHRRNHSIVNKIVRDKLSPETAAQVEEIEAELEADYRELTKDKSLQFNLAYAEGFEAMTLSTALARFDNPTAGVRTRGGSYSRSNGLRAFFHAISRRCRPGTTRQD